MYITELSLRNYRNYINEKIPFYEGLNVIVGDNAQGKTNIIEAILLCCVGRSPRTTKDKELIRFDAESGYVNAQVKRTFGKTKVELYLTRRENKRIKVNELPISKMGELMENINAVFFSPDELSLIKEAPDKRRRFLDMDISQLKKNYFYMLKQYNEILSQRNNLLKNYSEEMIRETVDIWDTQLSAVGAGIIFERREFCKKLKEYVKESHAYLTDGKENLDIGYSTLVPDECAELNEIREFLYKTLKKTLAKDSKLCFTGTGPHRDDIKAELNGIDIRSFGSQGQQRTAALSMKLGELSLFQSLTGELPILLLDDVLSELDEHRQKKLMEIACRVQTVITATHIDETLLPKNRTVIKIRGGKVEEVIRAE